MESLGLLLVVFALAIFYLIPTIVAFNRNASVRGTVAVLNIFLGWTLIGWVVALALAFGPVEREED